MSGALSTFSAAVGNVVNAIGELAFGAAGPVVLGNFVFSGFEVPEQITLGTAQKMTVHKLIGGERVVDLMGPDRHALQWSGLLMSDDPQGSAQQLQAMADAGQPLPLVFGGFFYTVLIADFQADVRYARVPYRINCLVLVDEGAQQGPSAPDLTSAVTADANTMVGIAPASVMTSVTAAQTALAAASPLIPLGASYQGALASVLSAQGSVSGAETTAETAINGIIGRASTEIVGSLPDLTSAVTQGGLMAQLQQTGGYLNRIAVNMGSLPA